MHLRSGKASNKITKSANTGASMSSQTSIPAEDASVPTTLGATMAMPVSTEMGVIDGLFMWLWQMYQSFSPSNKVISRVSYPQGLSFLLNNSSYLFL